MTDEFRTINLNEFTFGFKKHLKEIIETIKRNISGLGTIQEHPGSYSLTQYGGITVAKVIPYIPRNPIIYSAFRSTLPESKDYAKKINEYIELYSIQREDFYMAEIPTDWTNEKIADVFREFMETLQTNK